MNNSNHTVLLDSNNIVTNIWVGEITEEDLKTDLNFLVEYIKESHLYDDLTDQDLLKKIEQYVEEQQPGQQNIYKIIYCSPNSKAAIGYTYDENLNVFIPPKPEETYLLDLDTFEWYPNPDLVYEFNHDGIIFKQKYIKELRGWQPAE
jgi:hypothetical protein